MKLKMKFKKYLNIIIDNKMLRFLFIFLIVLFIGIIPTFETLSDCIFPVLVLLGGISGLMIIASALDEA